MLCHNSTRNVTAWLAIALLIPTLAAAGQSHNDHSASAHDKPWGSSSETIEPMGMGLAPPVYLVSFMFMYIANPEQAAFMPAYSAALPEEVYGCLHSYPFSPENCSYEKMKPYFDAQASQAGPVRNHKTVWPKLCRTDRKWQRLTPNKYRQLEQINEPLGNKRAARMAKLLGIEKDMILTKKQYQCMIAEPRNVSQDIIYNCTRYLSNSNGNMAGIVPLSSYGLFVGPDENARSLCAPGAACLEFNKLFVPEFISDSRLQSLFDIARQCKFEKKLARLLAKTPTLQFGLEGYLCQDSTDEWKPSCIVETACLDKGKRSIDSCQESLVND